MHRYAPFFVSAFAFLCLVLCFLVFSAPHDDSDAFLPNMISSSTPDAITTPEFASSTKAEAPKIPSLRSESPNCGMDYLTASGAQLSASTDLGISYEINKAAVKNLPEIPSDHFTAPLLLQAFPGLLVCDFNGVEGDGGRYVMKGSELKFETHAGGIKDALEGGILTRRGYSTLVQNISYSRKYNDTSTGKNVEHVLRDIDTLAVARNQSCFETQQREGPKIKEEISKANYCTADSDCTQIAGFDCPFGCGGPYVNTNEVNRIKPMLEGYFAGGCEATCAYMCVSPNDYHSACVDNKCRPVRN